MEPGVKCCRCKHTSYELPVINGRKPIIEKHHVIFRSEGGDNSQENLMCLCTYCHDFIHSEALIIDDITKQKLRYAKLKKSSSSKWKERKTSMQKARRRLTILKNRLKILNELNTPENILIYGYRSYWSIYKVV